MVRVSLGDKGQKWWVCSLHCWGCSVFSCHLTQLTTVSESFCVIPDVMGDFYLCREVQVPSKEESSMLFMPPYSWLACCSSIGKELHYCLIYEEGLQEYPSVHVWSKTWIQICWVCSVNAYLLCWGTSLQFWYLARHTAMLAIECEDSLTVSLVFSSFTLRECLIFCLSLPEGGSSSGLKTSSHTGGSGVEKRSYTHGSSYVTSSKEWRHCAGGETESKGSINGLRRDSGQGVRMNQR